MGQVVSNSGLGNGRIADISLTVPSSLLTLTPEALKATGTRQITEVHSVRLLPPSPIPLLPPSPIPSPGFFTEDWLNNVSFVPGVANKWLVVGATGIFALAVLRGKKRRR